MSDFDSITSDFNPFSTVSATFTTVAVSSCVAAAVVSVTTVSGLFGSEFDGVLVGLLLVFVSGISLLYLAVDVCVFETCTAL